MSEGAKSARPIFIDTGAFFAWFYPKASRNDEAEDVFDRIVSDEAYRPLYTSRYVLSELATLMLRKASHGDAVKALNSILDASSFWVLEVDSKTFERAREEFERYDDHQISFVDHSSGVLCEEYGIDHVFAFDSDFRTLDYETVP